MPQDIHIKISGSALAVIPKLRDKVGLGKAIARTMDLQNEFTIAHIQKNKLSQRGPTTLGVRSGHLRESLRRTDAFVYGNAALSSIGTNIVYAAIHEFGGTTKPHDIVAKPGSALRFSIGGRTIFRRKVRHPGSRFPARAPISTGIVERSDAYGAAVSQTIIDFWTRSGGAS